MMMSYIPWLSTKIFARVYSLAGAIRNAGIPETFESYSVQKSGIEI